MTKTDAAAASAPWLIFLNYRQGDEGGYVLLLQEELSKNYGETHIFVDLKIGLSDDWIEALRRAVGSSVALVAVIGKQWLTVSTGNARRLDDPDDWVRFEIVNALEQNIRIFPVLVDGAVMPKERDLPEPMARLARRQALQVRPLSWKYDFRRLMDALDKVLIDKSGQASTSTESELSRGSPLERSTFIAASWWLKQFTRKRLGYWLRAVALICLGLLLGNRLDNLDFANRLRGRFLEILQSVKPSSSHPHNTALILIGDDEYWHGKLAGRSPIRRDYLADVVMALDRAEPAVIALDFDLRSLSSDGRPIERSEYWQETERLLEVLKQVSSRRPIILPRTLRSEEGSYVAEPNIYDGFDFGKTQISTGFITLPDDVRRLPLGIVLNNGTRVNSFAEAIVRAYQPVALDGMQLNESISPYATYLKKEYFQAMSSQRLLENYGTNFEESRERLAGKVVIVSGNWRQDGYGRGSIVGSYETPLGLMPAAFIHANYVEAILDKRTYKPITGAYLITVEFILALLVAVVFALEIQPQFKLGAILLLSLLLIVSSYVSWQALDLLYSVWLPTILLAGSLIYDQIVELRMLAHARLRESKL